MISCWVELHISTKWIKLWYIQRLSSKDELSEITNLYTVNYIIIHTKSIMKRRIEWSYTSLHSGLNYHRHKVYHQKTNRNLMLKINFLLIYNKFVVLFLGRYMYCRRQLIWSWGLLHPQWSSMSLKRLFSLSLSETCFTTGRGRDLSFSWGTKPFGMMIYALQHGTAWT